jgi:hypothetical protein
MRSSNRGAEHGVAQHNVGEAEDTAAEVERLLKFSLDKNFFRDPVS